MILKKPELLTEADVLSWERLQASRRGGIQWRNNRGAFQDATGRWIRYGLANDSAQLNKVLKSSDLIGIEQVVITPAMVGRTLGVFSAVECKKPDWKYTGTSDEEAQKNYLDLVVRLGGFGRFSNGGE